VATRQSSGAWEAGVVVAAELVWGSGHGSGPLRWRGLGAAAMVSGQSGAGGARRMQVHFPHEDDGGGWEAKGEGGRLGFVVRSNGYGWLHEYQTLKISTHTNFWKIYSISHSVVQWNINLTVECEFANQILCTTPLPCWPIWFQPSSRAWLRWPLYQTHP
jgi:hypothetical protein